MRKTFGGNSIGFAPHPILVYQGFGFCWVSHLPGPTHTQTRTARAALCFFHVSVADSTWPHFKVGTYAISVDCSGVVAGRRCVVVDLA